MQDSFWLWSSSGQPQRCGMGRKPTCPAQRQETRIMWADSQPHRQLMLATKAAWLGLGSLAACQGTGGLVQCPPFAKRRGGQKGRPPFGSSAQRGRLQPEPVSIPLSAVHPPLGTCLGSHCECPAVAYARSKGSSWAVARCLRPGPRRQTWPQHNSCAGLCSCRCFQDKKGLAVFMTGIFLLHLRSLSSHLEVFL